jgi:hypothetical protein
MRLKPETVNANKRRHDWRNANCVAIEPEEVAWRLFNSARNKAKSRGLTFDLRYNDVYRQVRKGHCARTGIPFDNRTKPITGPDLPFRASLDRIDNTKGYLPDNIAVVVKIWNHAKWVWNEEDVIRMAKGLLEQEKPHE